LKAQLQSLKSNESASLATYWVKAHSFGFHWHYHPEIELCYVQRGVGTRMVGDSVREFTEGDLVLVGSNLPHTWISQQYANNAQDNMQVFVVQFLPDLFKDNLLYLPEFQSIASLLKQASQGIFFKDVSRVASLLLAIDQQRGIEKLLGLMRVLHELAAETQIEKLTSKNYTPFLTHENAKRMQNIFGHIHTHFAEEISLKRIADIACMNEASFCRYFKQNTGQTLTEYINDLRISNACRLLIETPEPITTIANTVGFNSFANFNKCFVKRKQVSPRVFRKAIIG